MGKATRQAFGESLARLGESHPEIVVLDADLAKSTKSEIFGKKFPNRFYEMGIAEANMIGTAAGMSFTGKLPFLCSFGCFLTGRYDTIRLSVAYAQANVRLVGTHAGIGIGDDGHSQMGLEDISLMRALPTMGVFQPMDARETELVMDYLVREWKGPAYLRLTRQNLPDLYPAGATFQPTKLMEIAPSHGKTEV
ncbi:MAG: transketolase family protein, partial [Bdellovibrionota bacterium]